MDGAVGAVEAGAGAVVAGAANVESTAAATVPVVAASAVEGTATGAAASAGNAFVAQELPGIQKLNTQQLPGVRELPGAQELPPIQPLPAEQSINRDTAFAEIAPISETTKSEPESNDILEGDSPAIIAQKLVRKNLAEVERNAARAGSGSIFAKEQAASMTDEELKNFHVSKAVQADEAYRKALESVITDRGGNPDDEAARNDKSVQAEAYWRYCYKQTEDQLAKDGGIDHNVYGTKEWGAALNLAHGLADVVNAKRREQGEELLSASEVTKWAYVYYMEKKKNKNPAVGILKGILAFILAGGQDAGKEVRPELEGQRRRR